MTDLEKWQDISVEAWAQDRAVVMEEVHEVLCARKSVVEAKCNYEYQRTLASQLRAQSQRHGYQVVMLEEQRKDRGVDDVSDIKLAKAKQYTDAIQAENAELRAEQALLEYQLYTSRFITLVGAGE